MKAIVYHRYGSPDVLQFEEIDQPIAGDGDVLIKVRAASINPMDYHLMKGFVFMRKPKMAQPGRDVSGVVEAVGRNVTRFKPGDEVFGASKGSLAEYACTAEKNLAVKPQNVTFEEAATVAVAGLSALQALRDKGRVQQGQTVLVNGAAGGVGTFAVQIAKAMFGAEVTGVCSTRNVEMVRSIGAVHVIDYSREDFTQGTKRYDLIFDCVGNHSLFAYRRVLNPKGTFLGIGARPGRWMIARILAHLMTAFVLSRVTSQNFPMFLGRMENEDLTILGDLIATGKVRPVVDHLYKLNEAAEAMRYLAEGHARGKVVITTE